MRPWSWWLNLRLQRACCSREVCTQRRPPGCSGREELGRSSGRIRDSGPSGHRGTLDSGPCAHSNGTRKPDNPSAQRRPPPRCPWCNTSGNKPPATPEARAATVSAPATRTSEAELAEGANCRFSNVARGRAVVKNQPCNARNTSSILVWKSPQAAEELSPCITTEPVIWSLGAAAPGPTCRSCRSPHPGEAVLANERSHIKEKPQRREAHALQLESSGRFEKSLRSNHTAQSKKG
ncbi:unnamed protein product [Rangifer tarandus platyrhynchus]|uniref:Uncharacterized protein n=1 Tax=Rangifer tarandus platyrhynchus TaxID=3082113 RepID=A0ABN8ZSV0_RANTA|nr:unnamed protein product [Rangifer tarandus platyrhynchus]